MKEKQNGLKGLVIIGVLLSALIFAYFDPCAWTEVELSTESLIYGNPDINRLIIDDLPTSIVSSGSQSVGYGLGLDFFLPLFLFQKLPYKRAFALRC
jgi:hypothetical protein